VAALQVRFTCAELCALAARFDGAAGACVSTGDALAGVLKVERLPALSSARTS
jgi:hypothetical protein